MAINYKEILKQILPVGSDSTALEALLSTLQKNEASIRKDLENLQVLETLQRREREAREGKIEVLTAIQRKNPRDINISQELKQLTDVHKEETASGELQIKLLKAQIVKSRMASLVLIMKNPNLSEIYAQLRGKSIESIRDENQKIQSGGPNDLPDDLHSIYDTLRSFFNNIVLGLELRLAKIKRGENPDVSKSRTNYPGFQAVLDQMKNIRQSETQPKRQTREISSAAANLSALSTATVEIVNPITIVYKDPPKVQKNDIGSEAFYRSPAGQLLKKALEIESDPKTHIVKVGTRSVVRPAIARIGKTPEGLIVFKSDSENMKNFVALSHIAAFRHTHHIAAPLTLTCRDPNPKSLETQKNLYDLATKNHRTNLAFISPVHIRLQASNKIDLIAMIHHFGKTRFEALRIHLDSKDPKAIEEMLEVTTKAGIKTSRVTYSELAEKTKKTAVTLQFHGNNAQMPSLRSATLQQAQQQAQQAQQKVQQVQRQSQQTQAQQSSQSEATQPTGNHPEPRRR